MEIQLCKFFQILHLFSPKRASVQIKSAVQVCGYGGTGRRNRLRIYWRLSPCRFNSCYPHQKTAVISFLLIGYDKYLAKKNKKRISEKTLLTLVFIGGTLGSGLGMLTFRHKTAKRSY